MYLRFYEAFPLGGALLHLTPPKKLFFLRKTKVQLKEQSHGSLVGTISWPTVVMNNKNIVETQNTPYKTIPTILVSSFLEEHRQAEIWWHKNGGKKQMLPLCYRSTRFCLPVDAEEDVGETRSRRAHVLLQDLQQISGLPGPRATWRG